jgi:hypothetical protein
MCQIGISLGSTAPTATASRSRGGSSTSPRSELTWSLSCPTSATTRSCTSTSRTESPMRSDCAQVLSLAATPGGPSEPRDLSDGGTGRRVSEVKALFIDVRVEGFFLERFNDRGELVGTTQHETMDEAMWHASSEYELGDWRSCPEDVDPVAYIRAHSDRDSHMTTRDG